MKKTTRRMALAVALLAAPACTTTGPGGGGGPVTLNDLEGNWLATVWEHTSTSGPVRVHALTDFYRITLVFQASGAWTFTMTDLAGSASPMTVSGTAAIVRENVIRFTATGDPVDPGDESNFTLNGNTWTLDDADEPYEFPGDQTDTPASMHVVMQRQ